MGRFDALTQVDQTPQKQTPLPVTHSPTPKKTPEVTIKTVVEKKKPEFMKSRKPEKVSTPDGLLDRPEKYSTLIDASLIKKIKIHAAELEIKDYQVIAIALTEFFEKHK